VFRVQIEFGDGNNVPAEAYTAAINTLLEELKTGFVLK
jgi:hypothetical protein